MPSVRVTMIRRSLDGIPQHPLPAGFSIRWWWPGDRETWVRIHDLAEKLVPATAEVYDKQFGGNTHELSRRQAFLLDSSGREIGTATAWFDGKLGRVHWVAIVPEFQGRGLSKPLLTIVCSRLRELGYAQVYLTTDARRAAALALYRSFGFAVQSGSFRGSDIPVAS
jgi:ribosomal protein S18 acetylase RimI-like enzyme